MRDHLDGFSDLSILVLGDVMLDRFIWGMSIGSLPRHRSRWCMWEKEDFYPGGAANVARNLAPFAKDVFVCGLIGMDGNGDTLQQTLNEAGVICTRMVRDPEFDTICKTRVIARQQQVVRIDRERRRALSREQVEGILQNIQAMGRTDRRNHSRRLRQRLPRHPDLSKELPESPNRQDWSSLLIPTPRNPLPYHGVTAVKPNRKEAFEIAGMTDGLHPHPAPSGRQSPPSGRQKAPRDLGHSRTFLSLWGNRACCSSRKTKTLVIFLPVPRRSLMSRVPATQPSLSSRSLLLPGKILSAPRKLPITPHPGWLESSELPS